MPLLARLLALAVPTTRLVAAPGCALVAVGVLAVVCPPSAGASAAPDSLTKPSVERGGWRWPVEGPVLSTFRYGSDPFARGQRRGIRIGAPVGTPVRSTCAGTVRFAGVAGTSGRVVSVVCGRWTATYLHLAALSVRRGEAVRRGQRLGAVGRSGRPRLRASHLAFGARRTGRRWDYVDPLVLLPALPGTPPPALVPPARRDPPGWPPALGPTPAAEGERNPRPLEVPARAGARTPLDARAPGPGSLGVDGARFPPSALPGATPVAGSGRASPLVAPGSAARGVADPVQSISLAVWIGLAALTGALVAWPIRARRRRSQPKGLTVTGARAR
ncbi:MAG: peptidoglycan DD-metalloendopeptidase family protein [Solirubrobacteraceae bacterium]